MYVVHATPTAATAKLISTAEGTASTPHGDLTSPMHVITRVNATAYTAPLSTAQPTSPSATSAGLTGVASTASYSLAYLSRKKTLNVESNMAPFSADTASRPGATNSRYGTGCPPGPATVPTSAPRPMPTDSR